MEKPQLSPEDEEASQKLVDGSGAKIEICPPRAASIPRNGDTKIDLVEVREAFVGMGKEELMKFANDPFWVKLRWFLFALFWVLWFGMLIGAVSIIAFAPKCQVDTQREWFRKSPLFYINADQIKGSDGKDVPLSEGLLSLKDNLTNLGIKSILLDLNQDNSEDFKVLPKKFGSEDSLKKALSFLRESDIHTFLKIVPNHASTSHPWFSKSVNSEDPYTSYFVWANKKDSGPPSNWVTFDGQPAWTWNDKRNQYYLHQANNTFADFNFRNTEVVDYFSDVFVHWLKFGFCGIHLEKVAFLVESMNYEDELTSSVNPGNLGEYDFLIHSKTSNLDETFKILEKWASVISNNSGLLTIDEVRGPTDASAKLVHRPFVFREKSLPLQDQLREYVKSLFSKRDQLWLLDPVTTSKLDKEKLIAMNALFLLLPDSSLLPASFGAGASNNGVLNWPVGGETSVSSNEKLVSDFKTIIKLRESPSIAYGNTTVINSTVILVTRFKEGNPGYLIALNLNDSGETVNLDQARSQGVGENLKLIVASKSFRDSNNGTVLADLIAESEITMPPSSFAVMEYIKASGV